MLRSERLSYIQNLVYGKKRVKLTELQNLLNVSMETIRRDVQQLVHEGKVEKIYGGIQYVPLVEQMLEERQSAQLKEKMEIGKLCASLVENGDSIFIDSGTTTYQMIPYLKNKNITILTNSIPVINEILPLNIKTIIVGGTLRHSEQSIVSNQILFNFEKLNISKAFLCASGITIEKGVSDFNLEEITLRKKIMDIANDVYVAADHTKFERNVTFSLCSVYDITQFITDSKLSEKVLHRFKNYHIPIIQP